MDQLTRAQLRTAVAELDTIINEVDLIELTADLAHVAGELAQVPRLRGYDAVHLAGAQSIADPPELALATRDVELATVAMCALGRDPTLDDAL